MRVVVDLTRCQAHGECTRIAPEFFLDAELNLSWGGTREETWSAAQALTGGATACDSRKQSRSAESEWNEMDEPERTKSGAEAPASPPSEPKKVPYNAMSRRSFIGRSAGVALAVGGIGSFVAACGGGGGSGGSGGEVNVLAWQSYLEPEVKKLFEEENPDITLNTLPAASDQEMFTKVKAGGSAQVDVVFCNAGWSPTYYENDLTEPLDMSEFKASSGLYPVFVDDESLPYVLKARTELLVYPNMWSPMSMTWNSEAYEPAEPFSWTAVWDPEIPDNHVMMMGGSEDFIAYAGLVNGVPRQQVYSMEGAELEAATDKLIELKPFQINENSPSLFARSLASQKAWIGSTAGLGQARVINLQLNKEAAFSVVPEEGSVGWIDGPQLVKDARNMENAKKFIEFWAGNEKFNTWIWDTYKFPQCNEEAVKRVLAKGGAEKEFAESIGVNEPDLATEIAQQRPADNTQAWAEAWDEVQAA